MLQGRHYLLVIGIDAYLHLPPLYNAVKDARDLLSLLQETYLFDAEHTRTLFNEEATQAAIFHVLEELDQETTPEDNLLIYFSGHGEFRESIETGFWIPVDGQLHNIGTFLPFSLFTKFIRSIPTRHTVVIADSCYAGSMFTERKLSPRDQALRRLYGIPSRWLLTAGRNEVVSDGKPGDNSPFADSLLWHLRNHEEDAFSVRDLSQRVITDVSSNARQLPRGEPIIDVGHRGGEFIFVRRGHETFFEGVQAAPEPADVRRRDTAAGAEQPATRTEEPPAAKPPPRESKPFASLAAIKEGLQRHLMASEIERVFDLFDEVLRPGASLANDLILTRGQFSGLQRDRAAGLVSDQQINLTTNRIRNALLYYVERLDEDDLTKDALAAPEPDTEAQPSSMSTEEEAAMLRKKIDFFEKEMQGLADANQRFNLQLQIDDAQARLEEIAKASGS